MRQSRISRRLATAVLALATVTGVQVFSLRPAAAVGVAACGGTYTINIADSMSSTTIVGDTSSWVLTCGLVQSPGNPIEEVFSDRNSNSFTYTGDCIEGAMNFANGATGLFIAGIVLNINLPTHQVLIAVVKPNGVPCEGAVGSTRSWSGVTAGGGVD